MGQHSHVVLQNGTLVADPDEVWQNAEANVQLRLWGGGGGGEWTLGIIQKTVCMGS